MLADALAQYLIWKKWTRWVLVVRVASGGPIARGRLSALGEEIRRAHRRRSASTRTPAARGRPNSGVVQTQQQMPVFTQGLPDHDVLVAADESEVFAGYLPYRTWDARPVVGSAGLRPVTLGPEQRILGRRRSCRTASSAWSSAA